MSLIAEVVAQESRTCIPSCVLDSLESDCLVEPKELCYNIENTSRHDTWVNYPRKYPFGVVTTSPRVGRIRTHFQEWRGRAWMRCSRLLVRAETDCERPREHSRAETDIADGEDRTLSWDYSY